MAGLPWTRWSGKLTAMPHAAPSPDAIAIITVDRLPGWMLPAFGCVWVAMPHLDALAGRGLVFDRMLASSDDVQHTLQAVAGGGPGATDPCGWPVLAAAAGRGWSAAFVTDDALLAAIIPASTTACCVPPVAATEPAETADATNLGRLFCAATKLVTTGNHKLVWCHAASLGIAWDAPVAFRDRYLDPDDPPPPSGARVPEMKLTADTDPDVVVGIRHIYAGQLSLLDRCIGRLVEAMTASRRSWTILIMGVRGVALGLHGTIGCGTLPPYDELVHLPAILVDHRERMAAQRYGGLLLPDDLGATLLDLLGERADRPVSTRSGQSLTGLLDTWRGPDRDRVISTSAAGTAIATPAWHLVVPHAHPESHHLFVKPDDFFEMCDVADRCPAVADELAALAAGDLARAWDVPLSPGAMQGVE